MQTINVAIIGLKRIGGSVGLVLQKYNKSKEARQRFVITGYDPDEREAQKARTNGAVDNTSRNLAAALRDKELVVMALSFHEVEAAYQLAAQDLRKGTVVLDFSPYKQPSVDWAEKLFPKETFLVGITPIVNARYLFDGLDTLEHAVDDYFSGGTILLSPNAGCDKDAVQLASDFAQILGASVRFTDPVEHDSWAVLMEALPAAISLAVFNTIRHQEHWDDVRRVGNPAFGQLTHHLLEMHPDALRDLLLRDRERVARQLDGVIDALTTLRTLLLENDRDALEALLIDTNDDYLQWLGQRRSGDWDGRKTVERESNSTTLMNGLFGSALTKRLKRGQSGDD